MLPFGAQNMMSKEAIIALVIVGLIAVAGISYGVCELTDEHGKCGIHEVRVKDNGKTTDFRLVGDCSGTDNGYCIKLVYGDKTVYIDDLSKTYTIQGYLGEPYIECPHGIHKISKNGYWPYD